MLAFAMDSVWSFSRSQENEEEGSEYAVIDDFTQDVSVPIGLSRNFAYGEVTPFV